MRSSTVSDVIIFSAREEVVKPASDHLKMKGVSNLVTPKSADECVEALGRFPKGLLIVDWELGAADAVRVLAENRKKYAITGRPLLLIAAKVSATLVATAAEYAVSQIFTEPPTIKSLGARLGNMILAEGLADEVRAALLEVAEKRSGADHQGALQILQKTLAKHPTNLRLKCEAAETLMHMGETEKALALLEGMEKTKPPYLRGMHLKGRALMKLGRFDEALVDLEMANMVNPHDAERLCDIGQAMLNMDRVKDAEEKFERALELDPDLKDAKVGKGQVELMENNVNEALKILNECAGDLEMASVFNTCAVLNMRQGRHEAGMSLYAAALRSLSKDQRLQARLYFNMGIGYRRWNKKDKALAAFESAQKLDPKFKKVAAQIEAIKTPPKPVKTSIKDLKEAPPLPMEGPAAGLMDFGMDLTSLLDEDLEEGLYDDAQSAEKRGA
jgi:tetratricopeptide (TPR) repeat protein